MELKFDDSYLISNQFSTYYYYNKGAILYFIISYLSSKVAQGTRIYNVDNTQMAISRKSQKKSKPLAPIIIIIIMYYTILYISFVYSVNKSFN